MRLSFLIAYSFVNEWKCFFLQILLTVFIPVSRWICRQCWSVWPSAIVIYHIYACGVRELTYDEVIAEQRRLHLSEVGRSQTLFMWKKFKLEHTFMWKKSWKIGWKYVEGKIEIYLFSCNQAALWIVQSICLSVTPFSLCSHHRIIMKFSVVITNDRSGVHAKGQRSRSQRSKPNLAVSGLYLQFEFTYGNKVMHKARVA